MDFVGQEPVALLRELDGNRGLADEPLVGRVLVLLPGAEAAQAQPGREGLSAPARPEPPSASKRLLKKVM